MNLIAQGIKQASIFLICLVAITACGSSDKDNNRQYSISTDINTITVQEYIGWRFQQDVSVNVNFDGDGLFASLPSEAELGFSNRISFSVDEISDQQAKLTISIAATDDTLLNEGQYQTTLRLTTGDPEGNQASQDIAININILPSPFVQDFLQFRQVAKQVLNQTLALNASYDLDSPADSIRAEISPRQTLNKADAENANSLYSWNGQNINLAELISFAPAARTATGTELPISIHSDAPLLTIKQGSAANLPIIIRIHKQLNGSNSYVDYPVNISFWDLLTQASTSLEGIDQTGIEQLSAVNAEQIINDQIEVQVVNASLVTSTDVDWLSVTETAIPQATNSASTEQAPTTTVNYSIDPSKISNSGRHLGHIIFTDSTSTTKIKLPITLAVDDQRIFSNFPALSFNDSPTRKQLSQTVKILTNATTLPTWQATTDEDWLTLTPNLSPNLTDNTLTISVDSAKVAKSGLHQASVKLTTNNQQIPEGTITISFNKASTDAQKQQIATDKLTNLGNSKLDPSRPWLYVAEGNTLTIYNILTGELIKSLATTEQDISLASIAVHPNGELLLVSAGAKESLAVYQLALTDIDNSALAQANLTRVSLPDVNAIVNQPRKIAMISGLPVIVTSGANFAYLDHKIFAYTEPTIASQKILTPADQPNSVLSYYNKQLTAFSPSVNAYATEQLTKLEAAQSNDLPLQDNNFTLQTNSSGELIYAAQFNVNATNEWFSFSEPVDSQANTPVLQAQGKLPLPDNIQTAAISTAVDNRNNVYFYRLEADGNGENIRRVLRKYDNKQAELSNQEITADNYISVGDPAWLSPDYQRIIHYSESDEFTGFTIYSFD